MSCIQMTAYALQVKFFCIFFIIEMSCDCIVGNIFGKQVLVTFFARLVRYVFYGVFQFRFAFPIEIGAVFCEIPPYIF